MLHAISDALGVCCCCKPCFDVFVQKRDGRTAKDWFVVPDLGDDPRTLPEPLRGVFWLDGNLDPSLLSFTASAWDDRTKTILFPIYAVDAWASTTRLSQSTCLRARYVAKFDAGATAGRIRATSDYACVRAACCSRGDARRARGPTPRRREQKPLLSKPNYL